MADDRPVSAKQRIVQILLDAFPGGTGGPWSDDRAPLSEWEASDLADEIIASLDASQSSDPPLQRSSIQPPSSPVA